MTVKITPNDRGNPPSKLADAELHFSEGPLEGLKLIGFSIWERNRRRRRPQRHVSRARHVTSTASAAVSRSSGPSSTRPRRASCAELILDAYAEWEAQAAVAS